MASIYYPFVKIRNEPNKLQVTFFWLGCMEPNKYHVSCTSLILLTIGVETRMLRIPCNKHKQAKRGSASVFVWSNLLNVGNTKMSPSKKEFNLSPPHYNQKMKRWAHLQFYILYLNIFNILTCYRHFSVACNLSLDSVHSQIKGSYSDPHCLLFWVRQFYWAQIHG